MVQIRYELAPQQGWVKVDAALREMYQQAGKSFLVSLHQYLLQATKGKSRSITLMFEEAAQVFGLTKAWVTRKLRVAEESGLFKVERWVRGYGVDIVPLIPQIKEDLDSSKAEPNAFKTEPSYKTEVSNPDNVVDSLKDLEINNQAGVEKASLPESSEDQNATSRFGSGSSVPVTRSRTASPTAAKDKFAAPGCTDLKNERTDQLRSRCGLQAVDQELVELAIEAAPGVFQGIMAEFQRQRREIRSAIAWLKVAFRKGYVSQERERRSRYFMVGSDGELREADPSTPLVALPFGYVRPEEKTGDRNDPAKTAAIRQQIRARLKQSVQSK